MHREMLQCKAADAVGWSVVGWSSGCIMAKQLEWLTHALFKGVILNDIEWLSKTFNDMKHHAASVRQLSFLFNFSTNRPTRQRHEICTWSTFLFISQLYLTSSWYLCPGNWWTDVSISSRSILTVSMSLIMSVCVLGLRYRCPGDWHKVCLSICLSVWLSVCLCVSRFEVLVPWWLPQSLSVCLTVFLCLCLTVSVSVCF